MGNANIHSADIQEILYHAISETAKFDAPYGVLTSEQTDSKGKKYKSVTFGKARTLDAEVRIYNHGFMLLRVSNGATKTYKDHVDLLDDIFKL